MATVAYVTTLMYASTNDQWARSACPLVSSSKTKPFTYISLYASLSTSTRWFSSARCGPHSICSTNESTYISSESPCISVPNSSSSSSSSNILQCCSCLDAGFVVFAPRMKALDEVVGLLVLERQHQLASTVRLLVTQVLDVHLGTPNNNYYYH